MSIKISVIIPVYNCEEYLSKTLDSCLSQDIGDFEIICVNDGSKDSSLKILRDYEKKDKRIVVVDQENTGAGTARNRALKLAKGEFVAFIDSDDWYPDSKVWSTLYSKAKEHGVKAAGGVIERYFDNNVTHFYPDEILHVFSKKCVVSYTDFQFDYGYTGYIFERKMLADNSIGFAERSRFQDPPFLVRALFTADKIYVTDRVTYCYRRENAPKTINPQRLFDAMCGIKDNLVFAKTNSLRKLYNRTLDHIDSNEMGYGVYYSILEGNEKLFAKLIELNSEIDNDLIDGAQKDHILFPLRLLRSSALRYETLRSGKATRIMSAVPRRIIERRLEKEGK